MNSFIDNFDNIGTTTNGATAYNSTGSRLYDLFSLGGAYRNRSDEDCIELFRKAFEEDSTGAIRCLAYLRDIERGQGERRFFRICYKWLAKNYPTYARRNIKFLVEENYARWDDLYCLFDTPLEGYVLELIKQKLKFDMQTGNDPSLLGKWLPSENASSKETKKLAHKIRTYLGLNHKEYRKMLSKLRERVKVVEKLMSANRWDEIDFSHLPSKAGMIYRKAFERRDILKEKYKKFAESDKEVNADTLYPYEIVGQVIKNTGSYWEPKEVDSIQRKMLEKYWNNLPDYLEGKPCKMLCVVDTSCSMVNCSKLSAPINIAISLGMYCAERIGGEFKNHYISFSHKPQMIKIEGTDFVDKVRRIYRTNLCENTDLLATFRMIRNICMRSKSEDVPETLVIISDMQIDKGSFFRSKSEMLTEMEQEREKWAEAGLKMPHLVYWNCNAENKTNFLEDAGEDVTFVSGASPIVFKSVLTGKRGVSLMVDILNSARYRVIL